MSLFKDRREAGKRLAKALISYKGQNVIVLGLPRGGVILAKEIASFLDVPYDLLFAHKIGHPMQEEYAIAAISEEGFLVGNPHELERVDPSWLEKEKQRVMSEIQRRRKLYLKGRAKPNLKNKIAILVDDGIATGLTMKAALKEVKSLHPSKIVVAIPISPRSTQEALLKECDSVITIKTDSDDAFLGAVGAYYEDFPQVSDREVIQLMEES